MMSESGMQKKKSRNKTNQRVHRRANRGKLFSTLAEKTEWKKTGRYEETVALCKKIQRAFPRQVQCSEIARSEENRPILALVISHSGFDPKVVKRKGKPVVAFQAGIHPGEIEGKDAGFLFLRELLTDPKSKIWLDKVTLLFIPILNVDGHEQVNPYNRPNQNGPEEMGFRANARNLNLNRDYTKLDSSEMAGLVSFLNQWDPIVYADFHASNGADFVSDVAIILSAAKGMGPESMHSSSKELETSLMESLFANGHKPLDFYPVLVDRNDPGKGLQADLVLRPRFSDNYWTVRNRLGVLIETHSWKSYAVRVKAMHTIMKGILAKTSQAGKRWVEIAKQADKKDAQLLAGKEMAIEYVLTEKNRQIEFEGYQYKIEESRLSGQKKVSYNPMIPQIWKIPFYDVVVPAVGVKAPKKGYFVPLAHANWIQKKLESHGISFSVQKKKETLSVEVFRVTSYQFAEPFEGRTALSVEGTWKKEARTILPGSLFVPIQQNLARLILYLFEPRSKDSFLGWGFFNSHFEEKEYIEDYVLEPLAEEMIAKDVKTKQEWEDRLKADLHFRENPKARLRFFYQRTPFWEKNYALYPIYRI